MMNRVLRHTERLIAPPAAAGLAPPVFIIGAPRCGSTLLMQVVIAGLDVAYLSNLHCSFNGAPALVESIMPRGRRRGDPSFRSEFGRTTGRHAPSECGAFWYRFFPRRGGKVVASDLGPGRLEAFRTAVRAFTHTAGRTVVFKNLHNVLRLEVIRAALPEALFLVLHRGEVEVANSILDARWRVHGDYGSWFSLEPPGVDGLRASPPEVQVIEQVRSVYRLIDEAAAEDPDRFLHLTYEDLTRDPDATVARIAGFLERRGAGRIAISPIGRTFTIDESLRIDAELAERVRAYSMATGANRTGARPGHADAH
jgi:hypothetical protein